MVSDQHYQFKLLPFWGHHSLRVFTKCLAVVADPLKWSGVHMFHISSMPSVHTGHHTTPSQPRLQYKCRQISPPSPPMAAAFPQGHSTLQHRESLSQPCKGASIPNVAASFTVRSPGEGQDSNTSTRHDDILHRHSSS